MTIADIQPLVAGIMRLLRSHDMPTVSTALAEVLAAWVVKLGDGSEEDDRKLAEMLVRQACEIAPVLRAGLGTLAAKEAADAALQNLAETRVERLPTRPVRKGPSPWGEPR